MTFDFNIENYTKDDLIQIFQLPSNYDKNILELNDSKLKKAINNNNEIDNGTRQKTINFINKAKEIILEDIYKQIHQLNNNISNSYNTDYNLKSSLLEIQMTIWYKLEKKMDFYIHFLIMYILG